MPSPNEQKKGLWARLGDKARGATDLILGGQLSDMTPAQASAHAIDRLNHVPSFDADYVGIEMMLGNSGKPVRTRSQIYMKYHFMMQEGMISTALRNHVQMALGGHETTGETVFIEPKAKISSADKKLVDELAPIIKLLNDSAHSMCFSASGFGDSYARVYTVKKEGIVAFDHESLFAPLVQPYEELGRTVGYVVSYGEELQSRLSHLQMVRLKMPRMLMLPQMKAIENAQKLNIETDDLQRIMPMPSLVGGSLMEAAEEDFDNLYASVRGLTGQRLAASSEEIVLALNVSDTTKDQRKRAIDNTTKMLTAMKGRAEKQVAEGIYSTSRHYHVMPTWGEKQLQQISSMSATSGQLLAIDDVLFHAKKLAGTLGTDISQLGFADLISASLGDGGSGRTSALAAERARILRTSYTRMVNDTIDRHMLAKYGYCWPDAERPYTINFYGSIAALEAEKQLSSERAMNKFVILVQGMAQLREVGLDEKTNAYMLAKTAELDQEAADLYAKGLANAKPPAQPGFGGDEENEIDLLPGGTKPDNEENQENE